MGEVGVSGEEGVFMKFAKLELPPVDNVVNRVSGFFVCAKDVV